MINFAKINSIHRERKTKEIKFLATAKVTSAIIAYWLHYGVIIVFQRRDFLGLKYEIRKGNQ